MDSEFCNKTVLVFPIGSLGSIFPVLEILWPSLQCRLKEKSTRLSEVNRFDSFIVHHSAFIIPVIRHYLTFLRQAQLLDQTLQGWTLAECWSQEKNRLLLHLILGTESRFVEASVDLRVGYVLPGPEIHRARKNTIDFFDSLLGVRLDRVEMHESERLVRFCFADGRELLFLFFGPGSGNVLLYENGAVTEAFQEVGEEYNRVLSGDDDEEIVTRAILVERIRASERSPVQALGGAIPQLGKRLAAEGLWRAGLSERPSLADCSAAELSALLEAVDSLYDECLHSTTFRIYHTNDDVIFSLISLRSIEGKEKELEKTEEFDDLPRAIRACRGTTFRKGHVDSLKGRMSKFVEKETRRLERSLEHTERPERHRERAEEWEHCGNILLAHLHTLHKGEAQAQLSDWEGNTLTIKLDPKLTPAENAERYFRKARGARAEMEHGKRRAQTMRERLTRVSQLGRRIGQTDTADVLEEIARENNDLFQMKGEAKEKGSPERFRKFVVEGGHEVYAGKNAANNDELTMRFARPNDIWMHARGTSGSHVVLRWNDAKERPPKRVLEAAAMIAAWYSGAKNSRLVPVAWTFKKHVRKPKGAAVGAVVMGREEVVMVEPRLPENADSDE